MSRKTGPYSLETFDEECANSEGKETHASCSIDIAIDYELQDKIVFLRGQMDNERPDQTVHLHSLIWSFVFRQQNCRMHMYTLRYTVSKTKLIEQVELMA